MVAYDIVDDLRRTKLAKVLQSYGDRIQYSVFLIDLTAAGEVRLRREVAKTIDAQTDSVLFCVVGLSSGGRDPVLSFLGRRRPTPDEIEFIV
ncbi:CRISPR-associated endonuclease Cas2 [Gordonia hydrophobica]|uniref:CRISPR-associated endoribonuclease Cas2 n=1 Tax=Gordonia hydrophobica TaxID=40516 RepID=A0ABZ2U1K3_9ACTN|nr:CRISPR-associated endonuclease Cas2 [Gordonia hydrophobica]MBM7368529.1 CRISPR-associated protein Cas2 [Gordonia hydrophobica]